MSWRETVLTSLHAHSARHQTRVVERQQFISEEMSVIVAGTGSAGLTPNQTLSRVFQELRNDGLLEFLERRSYLLLDKPIDVETEDLTDEALDWAIKANKLKIGTVETKDQVGLARRRRGQDRIRTLITQYYESRCAICDITDLGLLIASHIVAWAEAPEHRGDLTNVICLCRIHDALFERGYWSLDDNLGVLKRRSTQSRLIHLILDHMDSFRSPIAYQPMPQFLQIHRVHAGFSD